MTAHRCCPECGTELPAHGGTFCGCVGPFTAEHVDPMHIRPYVDLPEPVDEGSQTPDLEPFARCGTGETAEMPAVLPPEQPPAPEHGELRGPSVPAHGGGRRRRAKERGAPAGREPRTEHGSGHGGRRRSTAALAAAGVVAALGAGLLTTQALTTDGDSGDDRSLSTDDRALPDVPSGGPTEEPSRTKRHKDDEKPSPSPSRTGATTPRADRDSDGHTGRGGVSPGNSSSTPDRSEGSGDRDRDRDRYTPRPPQTPEQPDEETLRPGDTGSEVVELQRRLKQTGALEQEAREDGVYSQDVQRAVARYQAARHIRGDNFGEYGSHTRRALESHTSG